MLSIRTTLILSASMLALAACSSLPRIDGVTSMFGTTNAPASSISRTGHTRRMSSSPTAAVMASLIGLGPHRYGETSNVAPSARATRHGLPHWPWTRPGGECPACRSCDCDCDQRRARPPTSAAAPTAHGRRKRSSPTRPNLRHRPRPEPRRRVPPWPTQTAHRGASRACDKTNTRASRSVL